MELFDLRGFALICLIFIPLERLLALRNYKVLRSGWRVDLAHVFIGGLLVKFGISFVILIALAITEQFVPPGIQNAIGGQPLWLATIAAIVVADICFYTVHRMFHEVPFLWKFHAIHHSSERLDWLAAHRVHPVDQILTKGAGLFLLFVLGFSLEAIILSQLIYKWHALLLHANTRIAIGPLKWLVASPHFHHWHHSDAPEAIDKNFAGQLSILDLVFGTYYAPEGKYPESYGCDTPVPDGYLGQIAYPLRPPCDHETEERPAHTIPEKL
ncbi:MAG: sterol desaturase family protein [Pseudomonadota bacterium]